ncbi:MAG TPA: galactokinase [Chloroflexota bacterium]
MEQVVRAPGRVNLIGEHTDYNDGFVLPLAIDLELRLSFQPRADGRVVLRSREAPEESLHLPGSGDLPAWGRYVEGVYALLGLSVGIEGEVSSDIPLGDGLSSSAALELATARALVAANNQAWDALPMARLAQRAEIEYAGNRCGIMDQLAVGQGQAGHALLIDCRSLEVRPVPLPSNLAIVVCDSAKPRQLVDSAYNNRRAACETAARQLGVPALRDATADMLPGLPEELEKRARHVVAENQRVLDFVVALDAGDSRRLGELMHASHASLRDLYEVSCPELDLLVDLAVALPGCVGSRLTGAGFGGCTVSLVESPAAQSFAHELVARYRAQTTLPGRAWVCQAVDGVSLVP